MSDSHYSRGLLPSDTRVGWIGTGVMGVPMCGHVLAKGYPVAVHTRTKAKAEPLLARGAEWADSPEDVAGQADVVVTMVGFSQDVRDVYLAPRGLLGVLAQARPSWT